MKFAAYGSASEVLARRVALRRRELGWTIRRLAHEASLPVSTVAAILNPYTERDCSVSRAAQLASALGVSLDWLCGLSDDREP